MSVSYTHLDVYKRQDVRIPENQTKRIEAQVVYDQFETDLMTEESDGVKKLFRCV